MSEVSKRGQTEARDERLSRRGFIKYALLGFSAVATAGGVATPIVAYISPPKQSGAGAGGRTAVGPAADLPVGKGAVYSVNNKPVLVIHTAAGFHAVSAACTHLGCIVFWSEEKSVIACPCHEAYFTPNGEVISGPAPKPLPLYQVHIDPDEDQIYVEGGEG